MEKFKWWKVGEIIQKMSRQKNECKAKSSAHTKVFRIFMELGKERWEENLHEIHRERFSKKRVRRETIAV